MTDDCGEDFYHNQHTLRGMVEPPVVGELRCVTCEEPIAYISTRGDTESTQISAPASCNNHPNADLELIVSPNP